MSIIKLNKKGEKIISVILGALITGFMWRCRGSHGFGSSWGLFAVGTTLTLLIFAFYGNKSTMKFELIPLGALMFGATVTGWGTVNGQMAGVLSSQIPLAGQTEVTLTPVSPYKGLIMMLIMGFTLVPLFAAFVGMLFSKKEYKLYHFVIIVAVFFAVSYLCRATVSHNILNAIHPDAVSCFKAGLLDAGKDSEPVTAYLKHFSNMSWAKKIPYGRNYFMCIENISNCIAAIAVSLTALIAFKDVPAFSACLFINTGAAVSVTVSDIFLIIDKNTGFLANITPPEWLESGSWSMWEIGTGFGIGLFTMLFIAILPGSLSGGKTYKGEPLIPGKVFRFIYDYLAFIFVFAVVPFRTFGLRFFTILEDRGAIKDDEVLGSAVCAVLTLIMAIIVFGSFKKNILDKNMPVPFKVKPVEFARTALPCCFAYSGICYFLLGDMSLVKLFTKPEGFTLTDGVVVKTMLALYVLTFVFLLLSKKPKKAKS
ncbi:MAG: hypothetical protein K6B52_04465 [Clostridiales bacterium]|nr:hypothetical protein [Clostridiales bacterium]